MKRKLGIMLLSTSICFSLASCGCGTKITTEAETINTEANISTEITTEQTETISTETTTIDSTETTTAHNNLTTAASGNTGSTATESTETGSQDNTAAESMGSGYTVNEDGSYSYDGSKDTSDSYDKEIWEAGQWIKNEAWKMAGCESASEFVDTYAPGQGYRDAWKAYAQQNGADEVVGECWVYYHGKAAGNEPSYAINKITGEKVVSGPHAMLPGGLNFWGCGAEYEANFDAYLNSL